MSSQRSANSAPPDEDTTAMLQLDAAAYTGARGRVLKSLLESLLYEGILQARPPLSAQPQTTTVTGQDEQGHEVRYMFRASRRPTFARVQIHSPIMRVTREGERELTSISVLLLETRATHAADAERLGQFIEELEQTALKHAQYLAERPRQAARPAPFATEYDSLEARAGEGHPYHPSFKSRVGFSLADNLAYGPEFARRQRPVWLAVPRDATLVSSSAELAERSFLRAELGSELMGRWEQRLRQHAADLSSHVLIPVHPWQWLHRVQPIYQDDIAAQRIIALGTCSDEYYAQQSIRTLGNLTHAGKASLKLSLSIVNTSTARILAPHTVHNAPLISDWLQQIASEDAFLQRSGTILLREVLGVAYDPAQSALLQGRSYGALSCIWRESLHAHLAPDEQAVPFSALTLCHEDGRPLIAPWFSRDGERWLERLLDVALLPALHLLLHHGIGLEAHAQNMVLVHKQGVPQRVALKDFHDGVRFMPGKLARPECMPKLQSTPARHVRVNRNSHLTAERPEAVRDFLFDALLFVNFGELCMFLADRFKLPERHFWSLVGARIRGYQKSFATRGHQRTLDVELAPELLEIEKLTSRRMYPESDCQTHWVPCPWRNDLVSDSKEGERGE